MLVRQRKKWFVKAALGACCGPVMKRKQILQDLIRSWLRLGRMGLRAISVELRVLFRGWESKDTRESRQIARALLK